MEMPCYWLSETLLSHFMQVRSKQPAQSAAYYDSQFAKSALHSAGLESCLQLENQADTIKLPWQQTAEEPNKDCDTESSL